LEGVRGKILGVNILKEGYVYTKDSYKSFEYAAFFQDNFHVPDKAAPVVFRLQRLLGAEPVYVYRAEGAGTPDGTETVLNIQHGRFGAAGDIAFSVERASDADSSGAIFTITVRGLNGNQVFVTEEEFPFLAPDGGYLDVIRIRAIADPTNAGFTNNLKLYVKIQGGQYAYAGMEVALLNAGTKVRYSGGVRYNEKWSRNLEFDHRKWINR
jgi:hypothetical protein